MSSPAERRTGESKHRRGLSRVLTRMKTVLKKSDSSKTTSSKKSAEPEALLTSETTQPQQPQPQSQPQRKSSKEYPDAKKVPRSQLHEERARKLGDRFGIEIQPNEWYSTEGDVLRVEKPIRMRIHRTCHKCSTAFGAGKECPGCNHTRCKRCTRYPETQTEDQKQANRERRAVIQKQHAENAPILPSYNYNNKRPVVVTRPNRVPGGRDLVHKKPRQRVRRWCHECNGLYAPGSKTCEECGHVRCDECPRDPASKNRYPYGYPGDAPGPKSKGYFACHECSAKFPPHAEDGLECANCKHPKCSSCKRLAPKKVHPEPDEDILKTLQARLESLQFEQPS